MQRTFNDKVAECWSSWVQFRIQSGLLSHSLNSAHVVTVASALWLVVVLQVSLPSLSFSSICTNAFFTEQGSLVPSAEGLLSTHTFQGLLDVDFRAALAHNHHRHHRCASPPPPPHRNLFSWSSITYLLKTPLISPHFFSPSVTCTSSQKATAFIFSDWIVVQFYCADKISSFTFFLA